MLNDFFNWLQAPYSDDMSAVDWFLFIGLIIIIVIAWVTILNKINET